MPVPLASKKHAHHAFILLIVLALVALVHNVTADSSNPFLIALCLADVVSAYEVAHSKKSFLMYLKLHCQAISQGCTATALLGIFGDDLANPCAQLADGTEYSCIYLINCRGDVKVNSAGQHCSVNVQRTLAPEPTCVVHHGNINQRVGAEVRFGLQRAADKQQRAILNTHPTGLFNASAAVRTANTAPHAEGLCKGPRLNTTKAAHMAAAQKREVFGTGQKAASVILELQDKHHAALKERIAKEKIGKKVYTGLGCPLGINTCSCCVMNQVLIKSSAFHSTHIVLPATFMLSCIASSISKRNA